MPTLAKPSPIAAPFAYNGDKNYIPDSTASPGAASYQQGFPPVTQLPVTAGGVPPQRADFNGIFHALSQHIFWLQSGGMYDWSASLDYAVPAMVAGADGTVFLARQLSGPNTAAGVKNPMDAGSADYWQKLDFSGLPPIDNTTIVTVDGQLAANVANSPLAGRLPIGDATGHLPVGWIQDSTTGQKGVVKLNSATNSTSETEAATPLAVKQAYDKAASAAVTLNNTVTSTSTTEAGTANAVKTAYDKAVSAASAASSAQTVAGARAPVPQQYSGVGQWMNVSSSTAYVTLPSGGTWAYHLTNISSSGDYYSSVSGVASGGSQINTLGGGRGLGLAWRIA